MVGRNKLGFGVGDRISLGFRVGVRNWLDIWVELDMTSVPGSKLTWFLCSGRKYLILVSGSKSTSFLCRGIEILVDFGLGIELT